MSEQKPPQEVCYLLNVTGLDAYRLKEREKPPGLLARIFGSPPAGVLAGGSYTTADAASGILDHSAVAALLTEVETMKEAQRVKLIEHVARNPRQKAYKYTSSITAELWIGPKETAHGNGIGGPHLLRPGYVTRLEGGDITAENIREILTRCDTAETRLLSSAAAAATDAEKNAAIERAMTPPENPKLMKPLKLRRSP